ncbi:hypothetical protein CEXT_683041 [Caerostris extrusa]|uniref:Uncharacterized protein n=1 Tax=Caerostris extrusa TaxID=172846 RepID=A0AAV4V9L1_CAEEX|nr:hypothetical protein CEXT_683041 [Caerostris extrusa]
MINENKYNYKRARLDHKKSENDKVILQMVSTESCENLQTFVFVTIHSSRGIYYRDSDSSIAEHGRHPHINSLRFELPLSSRENTKSDTSHGHMHRV